MRVVCISNSLQNIPKRLRKYAFTQDEQGILDVTPGKTYEVFGIKTQSNNTFYLVHTDTISQSSYSWMPKTLYQITDETKPNNWSKRKLGTFRKEIYEIYPSYFDWRIAEGIEDSDEEAIKIFESEFS